MNDALLEVLVVSFRVAGFATLWSGIPAVALGYALARFDFPLKRVVSALTGLPLVLPPTAVGLLLLRLLAHDGPLEGALGLDLDVLLTWKAAVIAAGTMSLPMVVRTARVAFEGVDPRLESLSRTLGYGPVATFWRVTLPLARRGIIAALLLGFTRALGEFGATVTLAGNIPGESRTLSAAIYTAFQNGNDARANQLMALGLVAGLSTILVAEWLARPTSASRGGR